MLREAFKNLIDNALRHGASPDGHIDIRLDRHDACWRITVSDQGPGIPPALANTAFERFARGPNPRTPGAGLGLSIIKRVVDIHHGKLSLSNRVGGGLDAVITLPAGPHDAGAGLTLVPADSKHVLVLHASNSVQVFKGVLEDFSRLNPTIRLEYTELTTQELYAETVARGQAGAARSGPDLIISSAMDLQTKLVNDGYAQAHVSPETRSLPAWANWRDEVFSIGTDPSVMVYNTRKRDAARAPRTRRELLSLLQAPDQPLAGKISTYDVQGSGIGYLAATQDTRLDSMAGALLAALAGGGGNLAMGVAAFGQAAAINRQLGFSRDAEREADRAGFQMLTKAGYDAEGMSQMFSRLMNASRLNEGAGGGSWASTHPLSIERMSDVQNRVRSVPPSRHVDSDDFWYVRAKMRVVQGRDAVSLRSAGQQLQDEAQALSGVRQSAAYYGLALQAFQRNNLTEADRLWNLATAGGRVSARA
ncbi:hypothetical protein G6F65_014557 [Rhizopus arrhizus]|nr:hypothetical protein G6F65_014557 [Rhizopus arrhizus]